MTTYSEFDRDCAAMAIEAIDKKMAELWSTETFDAITEALKESELEDLRQERWEMWHIIFGFDEQGKGSVHTGLPGWPHDGFEI